MSVYLSNLNDKMKDTNTTLGQISTELGLLAISNAGDLNDPTTMARLVRAGLGETAYPVGSQVTVTHSVYGDLVFDVAAHNFHKKTGDENAPTMTLLMHDTIPDISFDAAELLWANTTGWGQNLPAGTYHFTLYKSTYDNGGTQEDGTYQFTTTKAIPYYGGFRHTAIGKSQSAYKQENITGGTITTYDANGNELESGLAVTLGDGGTDLGTTSYLMKHIVNLVGAFNATPCSQYGCENWKTSNLRQWLNSASAANKWWKSGLSRVSPFDMKPNFIDKAGFMAGLDGAFLRAIGAADVTSVIDNFSASDGLSVRAITTSDKFFIPSNGEVLSTSLDWETERQFPLFKNGYASVYKYAQGTTTPVATYCIRHDDNPDHRDEVTEDFYYLPSGVDVIWQYYYGVLDCCDKQTVAPACVIC